MNGTAGTNAQAPAVREAPDASGVAQGHAAERASGANGAANGEGRTAAARVRLVRSRAELRAAAGSGGAPAGRRAVVMTMGALHAGHAELVRTARERVGPSGQVVVTVFVNPLQFGPTEDLDRYPRTLDADLAVAGQAGADVVFAPSVDEVYPERTATAGAGAPGPQVSISAGPMGERFEGACRPGHFDGVLTVVAKLLHITAPDVALFGQKDAQQLALIRRMVADLDFPVEIVGVPTVREADGMALSSRNSYLSPAERRSALALSRALFAARDALPGGVDRALAAARSVLDAAARQEPPLHVDYLALVDPADFTEIDPGDAGPRPAEAVLAVAARVGGTRLIDNLPLALGPQR